MEKLIIDVSENNGIINWEKVHGNVDGCIIRCGYGQDYIDQDDSQFVNNVEGCLKYGIPFGVYLYSYADTADKVKSEVEHCVRLVSRYKDSLSLPIFYDLEEDSVIDNIIGHANLFITCMRERGYSVGIYSYEYVWTTYLNQGWLIDAPKWVAKWSKCKPDVEDYMLWQYTDNATVSGISGHVDASYYYGEMFDNRKKKTVDELAAEVLAGEWGNGDERKKRLEAAGYIYNDVQNKVNEILSIKKPLTVSEVAKEVIDGKWGNGDERKTKLEEAGYNYEEVQNRVNYILSSADYIYYTVKDGDTLSSIASRYNTTYQKIAELNNLQDPNVIHTGDILRVR